MTQDLPTDIEERQKKKRVDRSYGLFAHALTMEVLIAAPAAPLTVAKTRLWSITSLGSMYASHDPSDVDAKKAIKPIANPIDPNRLNIVPLDAMTVTYCWLSVPEIPTRADGTDGSLSLTFCSATAEASINIWSMSEPLPVFSSIPMFPP